MSRTPRIGIISHTQTKNDPRVIRQARTLSEAGYTVETFGRGDMPSDARADWVHHEVAALRAYENAPPLAPTARPAAQFLRLSARFMGDADSAPGGLLNKLADRIDRRLSILSRIRHYALLSAGLRIQPSSWPTVFWDHDPFAARIRDQVLARPHAFNLILANDWECLPAACAISEATGARVWYDSHEFAADEFSGQRRFRLWHRPLAMAVEGQLIRHVDGISSVSQGLCDALQSRYDLESMPACVRNVPTYTETPWREHNPAMIKVLYQGIIAPGRGLKTLVESVQYWPETTCLKLRGPHYDDDFMRELDKVIAASPVASRIQREGPVAFRDLVTAATQYDIGVMLLPDDDTTHNRYALPNKVFEYMMSGMALIVSELPEMSAVIAQANCGERVQELSPQCVAEAVTKLSGPRLKSCREASLMAAKQHNWEHEARFFLSAIQCVLEGTRTGSGVKA